MGIADYLLRHPSPLERESIKASELWNTWFTVNHLNDVLADEINQPIRGRRWLKLPRNDKRSKSAQLPVQNKQTAAYSNEMLTNKMGQTQSAEELLGIENSQISNRLKPKLKLANQIGQNLLTGNYLHDEFLQKIFSIVKNPT